MKKLALITLITAALGTSSVHAGSISTAEVEAAQQGWGEGIVKIGQAKNPKKAAIEHTTLDCSLHDFAFFGILRGAFVGAFFQSPFLGQIVWTRRIFST